MNNELSSILSQIDQKKEELSRLRPLPAEALKKITDALDIEYTYESNRIEGNTLTLQETALVVNEGVTISGKPMREHLEAINHAQAVEYIKEIAEGDTPIDQRLIQDLHGIVLHGIDRENAGKYRSVAVMISGSRHIPPQHYLIEEQMEAFITEFRRREEAGEHPVLLAAYLHSELVHIHPFIDGNGPTARLLMNLYLLRQGYTLVTLKGDNEQKLHYYTALEKAHTQADPEEFNLLVAQAELDSLKRYIQILGD
ncbi:MAG: Fic family protein [Bacteroides sp.]|nr:Fic family protein [Bacteroides sp.]